MTSDASARSFVHHAPTFKGGLSGYARCRRCGAFFTDMQFLSNPCPGAPREPVQAPIPAGAVPCALCGAPVDVAARHRETVDCLGTCCDACAGMVEAIGTDPHPQEAAA